jgi:chemotaxis protein CheZ
MMIAEKADFEELAQTLGDIQKMISSLPGEDPSQQKMTQCQTLLLSFHTTASMLGLETLAEVGRGLELFLNDWAPGNGRDQSMSALADRLEELSEWLGKVEDGEALGDPVNSVMGMLRSVEEGNRGEDLMSKMNSDSSTLEMERLERIVKGLGGHLAYSPDANGPGTVALQFEAVPAVVDKIGTLLSPWDPDPAVCLDPRFESGDPRSQRIIECIKDFMKALSEGSWDRSQEILLELSDQSSKSDLYNEIGSLARQLHSSIKDVTATLDPGLKEIVESKLPDSGNRLEHILELTERAATVTLDNVEAIQNRNQKAEAGLTRLRETLNELRAFGSPAQKKLGAGLGLIDEVMGVSDQNREDLISILTAQDFQDLTGQIIQKIIALLKDLEKRLVQVVRVFGDRGTTRKPVKDDELYGPAHKGKEEALHSQDDVDSLLAEFGF